MKEINYFERYKNKEIVLVSDIEYMKKVNRLSKKLKFEKNLSNRQLSSIETSATSCWIISSKKTCNKVNYKGKKWSVYICVVSFLSKNNEPFSEEIEVPSFVIRDFGVCDKTNGKQIGLVKTMFS